MLQFILNFHGVGPVVREVDGPEEVDCWLDAEHFELILDAVQDLPHVSLTFDDGNASDLHFVVPALLRRGLTASFFVCTGRLGQPTFLTREELRHFLAQGMRIGSHGIGHRPWRGLSPDELSAELLGSRMELEEICGRPVVDAACPFGAHGRAVIRALRNAGYQRIYTSDGGWAHAGSWLIPRNTVRRTHSIEHIRKLVTTRPSWFGQIIDSSRLLIKQNL